MVQLSDQVGTTRPPMQTQPLTPVGILSTKITCHIVQSGSDLGFSWNLEPGRSQERGQRQTWVRPAGLIPPNQVSDSAPARAVQVVSKAGSFLWLTVHGSSPGTWPTCSIKLNAVVVSKHISFIAFDLIKVSHSVLIIFSKMVNSAPTMG